jgi:hypothetical protein
MLLREARSVPLSDSGIVCQIATVLLVFKGMQGKRVLLFLVWGAKFFAGDVVRESSVRANARSRLSTSARKTKVDAKGWGLHPHPSAMKLRMNGAPGIFRMGGERRRFPSGMTKKTNKKRNELRREEGRTGEVGLVC